MAEDPFADPGDDATLQETKPEKAPEAAPSGRSLGLRGTFLDVVTSNDLRHMGVSINGVPQKWMVYKGKYY